jgi:hypothetical protein
MHWSGAHADGALLVGNGGSNNIWRIRYTGG